MVVKESNRRSYIRKLIKIYEALNPRDKKLELANSEIDFLVECIWLDVNNIDMGSQGAREHLQEKLKVGKNSIYTLRSRMKTKGWLRQDKYGYHYAYGLSSDKFNLTINLEGDDDRGQSD